MNEWMKMNEWKIFIANYVHQMTLYSLSDLKSVCAFDYTKYHLVM